MKNRFLLCVIFLLSAITLFAQYDYEDEDLKKKPQTETKEKKPTPAPDRKFKPENLSIGGYFGLSFGNVVFVDVSPVAAYRFHKRFALGTGVIYQYLNYKDYYPPPYQDYNKTQTFGGRIFPRVFIWEELFAQMEYMVLNGEVAYVNTGTGLPAYEIRETFHNVFFGAGYNIPMGDRAYFTILFSINLTENTLYPNRQPYISFGFGVGL